MAPLTAFLGRDTKLPVDAASGGKLYNHSLSRGGWKSFLAHIQSLHTKVYLSSRKAQEQAKEAHDKGRADLMLQPGELVVSIDPTATSARPSWQGPFEVLGSRETDGHSYNLRHTFDGSLTTLHEQRLRRFNPYRMTDEDLRNLAGTDQDEYFVEAIREVVIQSNGQAMVLVKWRFEDLPTWQKLSDVRETSLLLKFIAERGWALKPIPNTGEYKLVRTRKATDPVTVPK